MKHFPHPLGAVSAGSSGLVWVIFCYPLSLTNVALVFGLKKSLLRQKEKGQPLETGVCGYVLNYLLRERGGSYNAIVYFCFVMLCDAV